MHGLTLATFAALITTAVSPIPAHAAGRGFTVTSFEKIRVEGPYAVELRTGTGPSARATGDQRALDRMVVEVQGQTLVVKTDRAGSGGWAGAPAGGVALTLTTPALASAALSGSGSLAISRMAGPRADIWVSGSGNLSVAAINTERLGLNIAGSGKALLAGKAAQAHVSVLGAGDVAAAGLTVQDADVMVAGSGNVTLTATRRATVKAEGAGDVTITGEPACAVTSTGAGVVRCGEEKGAVLPKRL